MKPRCLEHSGKTGARHTELGAAVYQGDITNLGSLQKVFGTEEPRCVIHCAVLISVGHKLTDKLYHVLNMMRKERNMPPIPWRLPTGLLRMGAAVTERIMRRRGKEPMFTTHSMVQFYEEMEWI